VAASLTEQADYVCQVNVTASQAALLSAACQEAIYATSGIHSAQEMHENDPVLKALVDLRDFLRDVSLRPTAYPVRGEMARTLKTRARRLKGPAGTLSKKHRANYQAAKAEKRERKARQRAER
jgi:hypothetical protein